MITLPKKGNLLQCQNYRTISLISYPSKVMLKIILNRLKPQVEKIIAEEQAGIRPGRSTTEQIFNLRILCEKCKAVKNNINKCMKSAKENWVGEQCSETEENLKNNSKRVYQLVKDLTTVKQGKAILSKIVQENASQKIERY